MSVNTSVCTKLPLAEGPRPGFRRRAPMAAGAIAVVGIWILYRVVRGWLAEEIRFPTWTLLESAPWADVLKLALLIAVEMEVVPHVDTTTGRPEAGDAQLRSEPIGDRLERVELADVVPHHLISTDLAVPARQGVHLPHDSCAKKCMRLRAASIALSWVRSHGAELDIPASAFEQSLHVHFPAGATPKDGPSAGVTMVTALVSLLTGRPVRSDIAMTGEVTLSGRVLPIGGVKQKLLAAQRAGVAEVFIPERNRPDLDDVPAEILETLTVTPVGRVTEILDRALVAGLPVGDVGDSALGRALATLTDHNVARGSTLLNIQQQVAASIGTAATGAAAAAGSRWARARCSWRPAAVVRSR